MLGFLSFGRRRPGTGQAVGAPSRGRSIAGRLGSALALLLVVAPAAAFAVSGPGKQDGRQAASASPPIGQPLAGTWRLLPAAPIVTDDGPLTSVWTGRQLIVFGRRTTRARDGAVVTRVNVAAAYDPRANTWRRLEPPPGPTGFLGLSSAWTGTEMLVWGQGTREAYNPRTNQWRRLPGSPYLSVHDGFGLVAWTGRELIGWGGGCCGDAFSDGVAYSPATNSWRRLAASPLAGSQHPVGAWTGRELIVLVGDRGPDGNRWPARLARAATYNPTTDTWRRIAPLPAPRGSASAVWDGREVLVVGGTGAESAGFAYDPATNRWRRLPRMEPDGRTGAAAVWADGRLGVWGGRTAGGELPARGLAFDPRSNRWSALPRAPLRGRLDPTVVWTGRELIVWGGGTGRPPYRGFADGAVFRPTTR